MAYLNSGEGDEKSKNVVGAFKDAEDSDVTHDFLKATLSHIAHSSENLDGLISTEPCCLLQHHQNFDHTTT